MATWTIFAHDSRSGEPLAELPVEEPVIEEVLSGISTFTWTLPLYNEMSARKICAPWLREVTVVRDLGMSGGNVIAFHGPIVARVPSLEQQTVSLSAADPMAYFAKRVTEHGRKYSREQFSIVRSLMADAMAKTGGSLYRLTVDPGSSGVNKALNVGGTERRYVADVIEELSQDANSGFDYRWDYTWHNLSQRQVARRLTLGYPTIGRNLESTVTVEETADLVDIADPEDGLVAANRVHVLGAGTGTKRLRAVSNSGSSLNAGYPLLETVVDRSDVKEQTRLNGIAAALRNALLPGTRGVSTAHSVGPHFPYGRVDLGDRIRVKVNEGTEQVNVARRVVAITTELTSDIVRFNYYDPADGAA